MMLSVMVMSTGAVTITDADDISPQYAEAAEVLTGMGIINGYEDDSFQPQNSIKRSEVAAMIYRAATSDVEDNKVDIVADSDLFTDVNPDDWYAGYVNYCGDAEYIKGYEDDSFRAENQVTGYEVLAMILRAVGYDKNNEFTGDKWTIKVASTATELGMLENLDNSVNLNAPATREVVAELIFRAIEPAVETVHYSPAAGTYREEGSSLGEQQFDLTGPVADNDDWGRPGTLWTYEAGETMVMEDALVTYYEPVTECQMTDDVNNGKDMNKLGVWINGNEQSYTYSIQANDVVTKLGAQGRTTEVYSDRIVMIDTFLAKVEKVTDATYDKAGHLDKEAELTLLVYDGTKGGTSITLKSETNWDYSVGDMLLLNDKTVGNNDDLFGKHGTANSTTVYKICGLAESFVGAQTTIHYNADKHTVNGTTYPDTNTFHLDEATTETTNHIWYMDEHDNLIGVSNIDAVYSYGTIDTIQWVNPQSANGYAQATLVLMDGSKLSNVTIKAIGDATGTNEPTEVKHSDTTDPSVENAIISATQQNNHDKFHGNYLYQIEQNSDGSYTLCAVANTAIDGARLGTDVTVTAKVADVAKGTGASSDAASKIVMDSSTQYLIQSKDTDAFTTVTGFNNIETYNNATVDYVDEDNDGRVDYVFIIGDPVSAKTAGLFYAADEDVTYSLNTETGVYTINGIFNGAAGSIQVVDPSKLSSVTNLSFVGLGGGTRNYTTAKEFVERICDAAANNHVLLDVTIQSGYVVKAEVVTATAMDLNNETDFTGPYTKLDGIRYQTAKGSEGKYADDVLSIGGVNYNVTTATKFIIDGVIYSESALAEGAVYDNHIIHVVYDDASKNATEVYVYSAAQGSSATNPGATQYTLTFTISGAGKTVTTTGGVVIPSSGTQQTIGSYTFVVYTGYGSSPSVTASPTATITLDSTNGNAYTYTISGVTANTAITIA